MKTFQQALARPRAATAVLISAVVLLSACGDGQPSDLCEVAPLDEPDAYVEDVRSRRADREQAFRTAEWSPVPEDARADWQGLEYYPVDPSMRVRGPLIRKVNGRDFDIVTTTGELRPCREIGYFLVDLGAGPEKLPVYELLDQGSQRENLFIPFADATTGGETYPAGRYLEVVEIERGLFLLDFNAAYNPSCAYGGNFQCPVAPQESHLKAAVRAGERGWSEHAAGAG